MKARGVMMVRGLLPGLILMGKWTRAATAAGACVLSGGMTAVTRSCNLAAMGALVGGMREEEAKIREGGGAKAAEAQRAKGRLTVRERLALLLDPEEGTQVREAGPGAPSFVAGGNFLELGLWAAHGMYEEFGGAPGAGGVTGLGRVSGRLWMIVANEAMVKAGA